MTQLMTHPEGMYLYLAVLYCLIQFYWLCRLLSLRPVLPLGHPDWQIHRYSHLQFLSMEAKCNWNEALRVVQPCFVFSHDPWILLPPGKTCAYICTWRAVIVFLLSPPTHTHILYSPLSPAEWGGVYR